MEHIEKYRDIIMRVLREWTEVPPAYGEMIDEIIVDREADRYLWMTRGVPAETQTYPCLYCPY